MKKLFTILVAALLITFTAVGANANLIGTYFTQDDFRLFYSASPGEAGSTFVAYGDVKFWDNNFAFASFELKGTNTLGAQLVGGDYISVYATTITIKSGLTPLFQGTGTLTTIAYPGKDYDATFFDHPMVSPSYIAALGPGNDRFDSKGYASFTGVGSSPYFDSVDLTVPWLGTYNWGYKIWQIGDDGGKYDEFAGKYAQFGNTQSELTVPEPGTLLLLGAGLLGLAAFRRKKD